jgi:DGQHR domain-containing protein
MNKRKKRKGAKKPIDPQILEQRKQAVEVRSLMRNIGFERAPKIGGVEFKYDGRTSELDDIFFLENIIVLAEYTVSKHPGDHLKNKKLIYDKINSDKAGFITFLLSVSEFADFKKVFESKIASKYSRNQLQLRIVYISKNRISQEHKDICNEICFFDYSIVKYFESISKIIKKTCIYEFTSFLDIPYSKFGGNILSSSTSTSNDFSGHILPEEQSSFKEGYKIITFYIDALSLMKRAFVLRRDGWKNKENVGLYQRMVGAKKIKNMRRYLHSERRVFINNLIVTLSTDAIKLSDAEGNLIRIDSKGNVKDSDTKVQPATIKIEDRASIIGIIDGQHRLYAYHEGNDVYEQTITKLRTIQNLLVTGILFPKDEPEEKRIKFEANLFLEINSNQSSAPPQLKQEIEYMKNPFSTTSISKYIINKLNDSGPLSDMFEEYWYQRSRLKTSSIISFGLKHVVRMDGDDSLFVAWPNTRKSDLASGLEDFALLSEYRDFCFAEIKKLFSALRSNVTREQWRVDRKDNNAILTVTTINGFINCLRLLVKNGKLGNEDSYKKQLSKVGSMGFKKYKSSQYGKMGEYLYANYF